jgi:cyclin C
LKNLYCETDPFIIIAACCYLAGKAEESPMHIKNVVAAARLFFSRASFSLEHILLKGSKIVVLAQHYGVKSFTSDNSKLADMEFYLVADLKCDLTTIFHPYRTLMALCKKESSSDLMAKVREVDVV